MTTEALTFSSTLMLTSRTSLQLAQLEREGGLSPHVSPMTGDIKLPDLAAALSELYGRHKGHV